MKKIHQQFIKKKKKKTQQICQDPSTLKWGNLKEFNDLQQQRHNEGKPVELVHTLGQVPLKARPETEFRCMYCIESVFGKKEVREAGYGRKRN